jgi:hypothetical protein
MINRLLLSFYLFSASFAFAFVERSASSRLSSSALNADRQPWNIVRFVQQSSKFVNIFPTKTAPTRTIQPGNVLWVPSSQDFTFVPLDDVVMGGASSSAFSNGRWKGTVTDANNGGFVGIRSTPSLEFDMRRCRGVEVKIQGDSKKRRFKLGLRDSKEFNGIVWTASFDVQGTKSTIKIPFDKLVPTLFAGTVPNPPAFKKENVVGLQFVYSKFEYNGDMNPKFQTGDIDVQIVEVKAY